MAALPHVCARQQDIYLSSIPYGARTLRILFPGPLQLLLLRNRGLVPPVAFHSDANFDRIRFSHDMDVDPWSLAGVSKPLLSPRRPAMAYSRLLIPGYFELPPASHQSRPPTSFSKMTMQSESAAQDIIALFQAAAFYRQQCCLISVTAVVTYDWVVTLSRETSLFWVGHARPLSAILYFSNKYLNVLTYVVGTGMLSMTTVSDKSCSGLTTVFRLMTYISSVPPAVFTALRAYALTRRLWLSILIFLPLISQFVGNMMGLLQFHDFAIHAHSWGCIDHMVIPPSLAKIGIIGTRVATILSDVALIVITWRVIDPSSISMEYQVRNDFTKMNRIASIMLQNGMTYFIVLLVLIILQVVFTAELPIEPDGLGVLNFISYFATPLSSILVSHFLLDLQDAHQRSVVGEPSVYDPSYTPQGLGANSLDFANMLGSLGATIDCANDHDEEDLRDEERTDSCITVAEAMTPDSSASYSSRELQTECASTSFITDNRRIPRGLADEVSP